MQTECPESWARPLGDSCLPAGLPFLYHKEGKEATYREIVRPGTAFEPLFIHTQPTPRNHSGSVLCCRKEWCFLQLHPLESPIVASQSPTTRCPCLGMVSASRPCPEKSQTTALPQDPAEGGPDPISSDSELAFARATLEHQADRDGPLLH